MGRKEKEVVVRLSEADLRAVGYIREMLGREEVEEIKEFEWEILEKVREGKRNIRSEAKAYNLGGLYAF